MNLFDGMTSANVSSLLVVAVVFTAAAGLSIIALIAFGVRAGLMAAAHTEGVPAASDLELGAFLLATVFGLISILLMMFLGFAENDLDNPMFFPLAVGPILLGGLFLVTG
ncbi:MAG TPA: hypothetical protein VLS53_02655, partial [Candidatus Dormibacteraeota bacterium]|nr:hypothetical protein [Candidatus Dormibacteraeota bacterium]